MKKTANLLVTEDNIDDLARTIRTKYVDLMVACDLLQLDTKSVLQLRTEGADPASSGLPRYVYDEIRKAEAQAEAEILEKIHDSDLDPQHGKLMLQFLEKTRSKYSARHTMRIEYEVEAFIEYTAPFIPKDRLMEWITGLQVMSGQALAMNQDDKLLR